MSTAAYQQYFTYLVSNPDFREMVAQEGIASLVPPGELEPLEEERLNQAARQPGMHAMRMLHKGFRLSKLLLSLPWSCKLLGDDKLARMLGEFWRARPSASFYYAEESIAFGRFLETQIRSGELRVPFLEQVLAEELSRLRRQAAPSPAPPAEALSPEPVEARLASEASPQLAGPLAAK